MFCLLIFASCKSAINNEETKLSLLDGVSDTDLVTPYTDMSLLENTRSAGIADSNVVNWKVARFFAVMEKVSFEKHYPSWKSVRQKKITKIYNIFYKVLGISDKAKGYGEFLSILNARGIVRMSKALRDTSDYQL